MALKTKRLKFEVVVCSFCGSWHASREDARRWGCTGEDPTPKFKVGDVIGVNFTVGAGMEAIGRFGATGKVVEVIRPVIGPPPDPRLGLGSYNQGLRFTVPQRQHEWSVRVKPVDPYPAEKKGYIGEETFLESEVFPVEKQEAA